MLDSLDAFHKPSILSQLDQLQELKTQLQLVVNIKMVGNQKMHQTLPQELVLVKQFIFHSQLDKQINLNQPLLKFKALNNHGLKLQIQQFQLETVEWPIQEFVKWQPIMVMLVSQDVNHKLNIQFQFIQVKELLETHLSEEREAPQ